jgi:hypothetical protein
MSPAGTLWDASSKPLRLGLLALMAWLLIAALGAVAVGFGCWWATRRRA